MNAGRFLFSFSGRLNRAGYWIFAAIAGVYGLNLAFVVFEIIAKNGFDDMDPLLFGEVAIFGLPLIIAGLAVSTRRLHDCDLSAWWLVVFYVVPGIFYGNSYGLVVQAGRYTTLSAGLQLIGTLISTWSFVQLGCVRGTIGPNRFGRDPLTVLTALTGDSR